MEICAVDTNILVRLLTGDDPEGQTQAEALFASHTIFIAPTVWLETEWVLRAAYKLDRPTIAHALARLLSLTQVTVLNELALHQSLEAYRDGLDFADALHYQHSPKLPLITFDKAFVKQAHTRDWNVTEPEGFKGKR